MSSPLPGAQTQDETPFDLYEEKRSLLAELQPLVDRGLLHVEVEDRPTLERLRSRMGAQRRGFHLFHYLGHAQPNGLRLERPNGRGQLVRSQMFAMLLQQMPDLRLAVFAGCETARSPASGGPAIAWPPGAMSVADYCVRDACPMVVGMQAVLPFGTERLFTRFFYQALTGGQPVAEALRLARLAIYDDEYAGGQLLNWAVPSLFVGGSIPDAVADPDAKALPVPRRRRVSIRVGVRQGELRFISRLSGLREAVDVLSARSAVRLLHVVGLPGTGKTAFLDRAMEELDVDVAQLFVPAGRLLDKADPLHELCGLVQEVLVKAGHRPPRPEPQDPAKWWQRLLDELTDVRLALVVDDGDDLHDDARGTPVLEALSALTLRRGATRLAVGAGEEIPELTGPLRSSELRRVQLEPLLWHEVWQWIRRNLPALTRYESTDLARFYHDLPQLEQWEQLAAVVAERHAFVPDDLPDLVGQVAAQITGGGGPAPTAPPPVFGAPSIGSSAGAAGPPSPAAVVRRSTAGALGSTAGASGSSRSPGSPGSTDAAASLTDALADPDEAPLRHALRLAVADPSVTDGAADLSRGVTGFAARHLVAGRVVAGGSVGPATSLAELLPLGSPFDAGGGTSVRAVRDWLARAEDQRADVVVLGVAFDEPSQEVAAAVRRLVTEGRLVLAASGGGAGPAHPASLPEVLAVGALDDSGAPAADSPYVAEAGKPDLYAPERLAAEQRSSTVPEAHTRDTMPAVLHAAAAAVLVWASDRAMPAAEVRSVLTETATAVPVDGGSVRVLDVPCALARVRRQLVVDALQWESLELSQLLAETGLQPQAAIPLLDALVEEGRIVRSLQDGAERYEDPHALYLTYARLRQRPSGVERTAEVQNLVARAGELALRGRFSRGTVESLWRSGHDGRRVVALGIAQARPDLGRLSVVTDGIFRPRSSFEQYQALKAALRLVERLSPQDRRTLRDAVAAALDTGMVRAGGGREDLAHEVLTRVDEPGTAGTGDAPAG